MKKLIAFYFLNRITKNPMMAANIYKILYDDVKISSTETSSVVGGNEISYSRNIDKKQEVEESLKYLRGKDTKTRKDKEAIQMLEAVLNNL